VSTEKTDIDVALNRGVVRVLEDTHCYVIAKDYSGWDGTSVNYTLDPTILEIDDMELLGSTLPMERLSSYDLRAKRRVGTPTGSPVRYWAVKGANLLMFYPAPGTSDVITFYEVPVPTSLSGASDDPSVTTFGGVPTVLHEGIKLYACGSLASMDDDQTSGQGKRYRDLYDEEITRYKKILRKRGGTRLPRAVVNGSKRRRPFHDNSIYPGGSQ
jgi:hypothetical protein